MTDWTDGKRAMPDLHLDDFIGECRYVRRRVPVPVYEQQVQAILQFCYRNDFPWLAMVIIESGARRAAQREQERKSRA